MNAKQVTPSQEEENVFWVHRDEQDDANIIATENRRNELQHSVATKICLDHENFVFLQFQ